MLLSGTFDLAETNESNYDGTGGILLWSFLCQIISAHYVYPLSSLTVVVVDPILSHNLPRPLFRKQNRNTLRVCHPTNHQTKNIKASSDQRNTRWFRASKLVLHRWPIKRTHCRSFFCVCNQNDIKQRESILIFKRIHLWTFFVFQKEVERK